MCLHLTLIYINTVYGEILDGKYLLQLVTRLWLYLVG